MVTSSRRSARRTARPPLNPSSTVSRSAGTGSGPRTARSAASSVLPSRRNPESNPPDTPATATTAATPTARQRTKKVIRPAAPRSSRTIKGSSRGRGTLTRALPPPPSTSRPSRRCSRRSAISATAGSWVTTTSVVPRLAWSPRSISSTTAPVAPSRLPVGSSASSTAGSAANARARATRCFSPPESWAG